MTVKQLVGMPGPNESKGLDGQLELLWQDNHIIFQTEIKRELRNAQLPQLEDMAKANSDL